MEHIYNWAFFKVEKHVPSRLNFDILSIHRNFTAWPVRGIAPISLVVFIGLRRIHWLVARPIAPASDKIKVPVFLEVVLARYNEVELPVFRVSV